MKMSNILTQKQALRDAIRLLQSVREELVLGGDWETMQKLIDAKVPLYIAAYNKVPKP